MGQRQGRETVTVKEMEMEIPEASPWSSRQRIWRYFCCCIACMCIIHLCSRYCRIKDAYLHHRTRVMGTVCIWHSSKSNHLFDSLLLLRLGCCGRPCWARCCAIIQAMSLEKRIMSRILWPSSCPIPYHPVPYHPITSYHIPYRTMLVLTVSAVSTVLYAFSTSSVILHNNHY